jgi:hypothetical protein
MRSFSERAEKLLDAVKAEESIPAARRKYLKEAESLGDEYIATEKCAILNRMQHSRRAVRIRLARSLFSYHYHLPLGNTSLAQHSNPH